MQRRSRLAIGSRDSVAPHSQRCRVSPSCSFCTEQSFLVLDIGEVVVQANHPQPGRDQENVVARHRTPNRPQHRHRGQGIATASPDFRGMPASHLGPLAHPPGPADLRFRCRRFAAGRGVLSLLPQLNLYPPVFILQGVFRAGDQYRPGLLIGGDYTLHQQPPRRPGLRKW